MKTITIIIIAIFTLQVCSVFASGIDKKSGPGNSNITYVERNFLAPVMPVEATFEVVTETPVTTVDVIALAPVTPSEVTFEDDPGAVPGFVSAGLPPAIPLEADFDDFVNPGTDVTVLSPATPPQASFEDIQ